MRLPLAAALAAALAFPARGADNGDPGGSSMGSLIMGSWRQAEREGHSKFCFTGLSVGMNVFPLYHYMTHVDGDTVIGHRECIANLEVDYAKAVGVAAKMGLVTGSGNSQYLELRRASGPEEPGWSDKALRGRTPMRQRSSRPAPPK